MITAIVFWLERKYPDRPYMSGDIYFGTVFIDLFVISMVSDLISC